MSTKSSPTSSQTFYCTKNLISFILPGLFTKIRVRAVKVRLPCPKLFIAQFSSEFFYWPCFGDWIWNHPFWEWVFIFSMPATIRWRTIRFSFFGDADVSLRELMTLSCPVRFAQFLRTQSGLLDVYLHQWLISKGKFF